MREQRNCTEMDLWWGGRAHNRKPPEYSELYSFWRDEIWPRLLYQCWHATYERRKKMSGQAISTVNELNSTPTNGQMEWRKKNPNTNQQNNYLSVASKIYSFCLAFWNYVLEMFFIRTKTAMRMLNDWGPVDFNAFRSNNGGSMA